MTLWEGSYEGKLPRVNEWHAAKMVRGHARIFTSKIYTRRKEDLAMSLRSVSAPITEPVNLVVELWMWSRVDTDAPIKGILDALEMARVIENDRQIRNIVIRRDYHPRDEPDRLRVVLISIEATQNRD